MRMHYFSMRLFIPIPLTAIKSPVQEIEKFSEKGHPLCHEEEDASISDNGEEGNVDTKEGGYKMSDEYMYRSSGCSEERLNMEDDSCTTFELHDAVNSGWTEERGDWSWRSIEGDVMIQKFRQMTKIVNQRGARMVGKQGQKQVKGRNIVFNNLLNDRRDFVGVMGSSY